LILVAPQACIKGAPQVPTPRGVGINPLILVEFSREAGGPGSFWRFSPMQPHAAPAERESFLVVFLGDAANEEVLDAHRQSTRMQAGKNENRSSLFF
jgi:hypothetical protein